uniref:Filamin C n=1 Tax=Petromyzon marinus TaxID=7757 RepID=S4RG46_PETMA
DSKAIVDGNLKLILGLVWTLILHYSISMPVWEDEEDDEAKKQTPKQRLLGWIQHKLPDLPISNFSQDWKDGRALGALVDSCAPGLCPDWEIWDVHQPIDNAREAMQQAEDWLGVAQVIAPEEIVDPNVDEHSVMTYLSQFPKAKLKPGAPLRPKLNPKNAHAFGPGVEAVGNSVERAAEFVVETENAGLGEVLVFVEDPEGHKEEARVTPRNDKQRSFVAVYRPRVAGPHKVTVLFAGQHIDRSPFPVLVAPPHGDAGKVTARGPGVEPSGNVAGKATYFDICTAGDGAGAGVGDVAVTVLDPRGRRDAVEMTLEQRRDAVLRCTYRPLVPGPHIVSVGYAGAAVPHSPFSVNIGEACNPGACRASGRGLQSRGVRVGDAAGFRVLTKQAGSGELNVLLRNPRGEEPMRHREVGEGVHEFEYKPLALGPHVITITWGGKHIPRSPFEVLVSAEAGPQKVRAWGPGLETGMAGRSADFVVEAIGTDVGTLGFSIEGPSQARIACDDRGDGSCDVRYVPTEPGDYAVHVLCDEEDVALSPFMAHILPASRDCFPERVRHRPSAKPPLPGLPRAPQPLKTKTKKQPWPFAALYLTWALPLKFEVVSRSTMRGNSVSDRAGSNVIIVSSSRIIIIIIIFLIDVTQSPLTVCTRESKCFSTKVSANAISPVVVPPGDVSVGIKCAAGAMVPVDSDVHFDIIKNDNDTLTVKYTPPCAGRFTIMVFFSEQEVRDSPFGIDVVPSHDASKVRVEGPGINATGVEAAKPAHFTVYTRGAGKAELDVQFEDPRVGAAVPILDSEIIDNHDYSYTVKYTPGQQGGVCLGVTYGGDHVPGSPFPVTVAPPLDLGKIRVEGLGTKLEMGCEQEVRVVTRGAGGRGQLEARLLSPTRQKVPCSSEPLAEAAAPAAAAALLETGPHRMDVTYDGHPVPGSPFLMEAVLPANPSKVRVWGEGLRGGEVGIPAEFCVDTTAAGVGGLGLTVEGPCEARLECHDHGDGTCSVSYLPVQAGEYAVNILFADAHVPGSPFTAVVKPSVETSGVQVFGPGVEKGTTFLPPPLHSSCSLSDSHSLLELYRSDPNQQPEHLKWKLLFVYYSPSFKMTFTCLFKYIKAVRLTPVLPTKLHKQKTTTTSITKASSQAPPSHPALRDAVSEFAVDARTISRCGGDHVRCAVMAPSGITTEGSVTDNHDGTYAVEYVPSSAGPHAVEVTYAGARVPRSPFRVAVADGCDPSRVRVHGPGLEGGLTHRANVFSIDTRAAGCGGLGLHVEGPGEAHVAFEEDPEGGFTVEYHAPSPGEYLFHITYGGTAITAGSPFGVPVRDEVNPAKVRCSGPGLGLSAGGGVVGAVRAGAPQMFSVDCSRAGDAALDVTAQGPHGTREPVEVVQAVDGIHAMTYTPSLVGPYSLHVQYAGQDVPHSPFGVDVLAAYDAGRVRVSGAGVSASGVPASLPTDFTIDTREAGDAPLSITIVDPDGFPRRARVLDGGDGLFSVSYLPDVAGRYSVAVGYGTDEVPGSPFPVHAFATGDASKCFLAVRVPPSPLPGVTTDGGPGPAIQIGEPTLVLVNAKEAGRGKVTCRVLTPEQLELDVDVVENAADGTFSIVFTATQPGPYVIAVRFGGQLIPNSPFHVLVRTSPLARRTRPPTTPQTLTHPAAGGRGLCERELWRAPSESIAMSEDISTESLRPFHLVVPFSLRKGHITGEVHMPSGRKASPRIIDNRDGTMSVSFAPIEKGLHEMDIKYNGHHIPTGSPLQFYVDEMDGPSVTAYGPGLSHGMVGKHAAFTIDTKDAGEGGLSLAVEGPSKAEISCQDNKDGTCSVSYLPTAPGDYSIAVKFAGQHIPGSPYMARIIAGEDSLRASLLSRGSTHDVSLRIPDDTDPALLTADIAAPSGRQDVCLLKRLDDGQIGISFSPKEVGEHLVSVREGGRHVPSSPFRVAVGASEVGDARRVRASGLGLEEARTCEAAEFIVDTRYAGFGSMCVSMEGPSRVELHCEDLEDGRCRVWYCPPEPGTYHLAIKFAEEQIPGSPFTVLVSGPGRQKEEVSLCQAAAPVAVVGSTCSLPLAIPGNELFNCTAQRQLPPRVTRSGHYSVSRWLWRVGRGAAGGSDARLASPKIGETFKIYNGGTRGGCCGAVTKYCQREPAEPSMAHEGTIPQAACIHASDLLKLKAGQGSYPFVTELMCSKHSVTYKASSQRVAVCKDRRTSRLVGNGGHRKVRLWGVSPSRATQPVCTRFYFWTHKKGARASSVDVDCVALNSFAVHDRLHVDKRVSQTKNGINRDYEVSVRFEDEHIPGSPFLLTVDGVCEESRRVAVSGLLESGWKVNHPASFAVHLNGAKGRIEAKVHTPSGSVENCFVSEIDKDKWSLLAARFVPRENGVHPVSVTCDGASVPGSPFRVRVGEPGHAADAALVSAFGPGLERGTTGSPAEFVVDTSGAGPGSLAVAIDGPSKVRVDCSEGPEGYHFCYLPTAPGLYLVSICYGGPHHIAGSPYRARVTGPRLSGGHNLHETSSFLVEAGEPRRAMNGLGSEPLPLKTTSDSSKVESHGPGLSTALVGKQNAFTVDCGRAGSNVLLVGVLGPSVPCEEVHVKHAGGRRFAVTYAVKERGSYLLIVKWGDQHVPGSPFRVTVP